MNKMASGTYVEAELILSKAFNELTNTGKKVLLLFLLRRPMERINGDGSWSPRKGAEIRFTYKEAENEFGISQSTFYRILGDFISKGFIDVIRQGGSLDGDASLYAMIEKWRDYGTDHFINKDRPKGMRIGFTKNS